jgi:hypothetical protein
MSFVVHDSPLLAFTIQEFDSALPGGQLHEIFFRCENHITLLKISILDIDIIIQLLSIESWKCKKITFCLYPKENITVIFSYDSTSPAIISHRHIYDYKVHFHILEMEPEAFMN